MAVHRDVGGSIGVDGWIGAAIDGARAVHCLRARRARLIRGAAEAPAAEAVKEGRPGRHGDAAVLRTVASGCLEVMILGDSRGLRMRGRFVG